MNNIVSRHKNQKNLRQFLLNKKNKTYKITVTKIRIVLY